MILLKTLALYKPFTYLLTYLLTITGPALALGGPDSDVDALAVVICTKAIFRLCLIAQRS